MKCPLRRFFIDFGKNAFMQVDHAVVIDPDLPFCLAQFAAEAAVIMHPPLVIAARAGAFFPVDVFWPLAVHVVHVELAAALALRHPRPRLGWHLSHHNSGVQWCGENWRSGFYIKRDQHHCEFLCIQRANITVLYPLP